VTWQPLNKENTKLSISGAVRVWWLSSFGGPQPAWDHEIWWCWKFTLWSHDCHCIFTLSQLYNHQFKMTFLQYSTILLTNRIYLELQIMFSFTAKMFNQRSKHSYFSYRWPSWISLWSYVESLQCNIISDLINMTKLTVVLSNKYATYMVQIFHLL
jgi:hypothetical protein